MELSLFLSKLFGLYFLAFGIAWALREKSVSQNIYEFLANPSMVFLSGLLSLAAGIAMIISHSVWEPNWRGVVTLLGYLSFAKGMTRIAFPALPERTFRMVQVGSRAKLMICALIVLGGYLTLVGFSRL